MSTKFSPIECAGVGDLVTIGWKSRGIQYTTRARITQIFRHLNWVKFINEEGVQFAEWNFDKPRETWCIIHERAHTQTEMFSENWIEELKEKL